MWKQPEKNTIKKTYKKAKNNSYWIIYFERELNEIGII